MSLIESSIQKVLTEHKDLHLAADYLFREYEEKALSLHEAEALMQFFLNCGLYKTAVDFFSKRLRQKSPLPWAHLLEALALSGVDLEKLNPEVIDFMLQGLATQNLKNILIKTQHAEKLIADIENLRASELLKAKQKKNKILEEIKNDIEIFRNQGLLEKEEEKISELQKTAPNDPALARYEMNLRERKIQKAISSRERRKSQRIPLQDFEPLDSEMSQALDSIQKSMLKAAKKNPELCEDFAMAHFFWDSQEKAIEFFDQNKKSQIWLKLEALLKSRRFAEALSSIDQFSASNEKTLEADDLFALQYLKAQALWGLKQHDDAYQLMKELSELRPDYRMVSLYLEIWKESEF